MRYIALSNDALLFYMMINGSLGLKIIVLIVDNFKDNLFFKKINTTDLKIWLDLMSYYYDNPRNQLHYESW